MKAILVHIPFLVQLNFYSGLFDLFSRKNKYIWIFKNLTLSGLSQISLIS